MDEKQVSRATAAARDREPLASRSSTFGSKELIHGDTPGQRRRSHPRYRVGVEVGLHSDSNLYSGLSENLSIGGVFVATYAAPPPVGSAVDVELHLPTLADPVQVSGSVAWLRDSCPPSVSSPGMGIRFAELSDDALEAVSTFLKYREPLLHDEAM